MCFVVHLFFLNIILVYRCIQTVLFFILIYSTFIQHDLSSDCTTIQNVRSGKSRRELSVVFQNVRSGKSLRELSVVFQNVRSGKSLRELSVVFQNVRSGKSLRELSVVFRFTACYLQHFLAKHDFLLDIFTVFIYF